MTILEFEASSTRVYGEL